MADSHTATILVTDLVGSTELRVELGEERADELGRAQDELLRAAVEGNGGSVVKRLGDGVLAMFDSASDAVTAAVAVQQAAYAHTRAAPDQPLDIRVGLSAGDVTLEDDDCFGTPVVEACRLCTAAVGGQILVAELVRLLARGRGGHVFTAAGERELKGLPEPVPVVTVGWDPPELTGTHLPFPARLTPQAPLPFSGRGAELDPLVHTWKEVAAGDKRVVLISGEPGIGKTRLAAEVARGAHDAGAAVLYGRCDEDMGVPFQPFVEALKQVVEAGHGAEQLGHHAGELVRLVPDLARSVPDLEPPLSSDPETERYRLFDAVAAWLAALAEPAGVVLVLDDLHWAEKPTLLLLRHLIRAPDAMRVLVLGTYRDTDLDRAHPLAEVLADLRREPGVTRLALSGLDVEGIAELLASASGERMDLRAGELAELLWAETEGNPFFVQEVLRSLVESGSLVQRDGVWTTDLEISELGISEGVREVVGRRLSRLSETANSVLAVSSVIGALVDVGLLVSVAGVPEDAVLDALDEATAAALLRETASGAYEFTHALVRSTLYDEQSATRRVRRHRQVAEALEGRGSDDAAALAYHFGRAGLADERAVDYATAAGDGALDQLAFDQAVTFFVQALEAADDGDADSRRRCELLIRLGTAQRLAGIPDYRETLLEASGLAQSLGDGDLLARAALANNRGFFSATGGLDEERVRVLEAALEAVDSGDSAARARLLAVLAVELSWHDPKTRRYGLGDEAVAMARRLGDDGCLLEVWTARHISRWTADSTPELVAELPALLDLAERVGDPQSLVLASSWGFAHMLETGDVEESDRLVDQVGRIATEMNNPVFRWLEATYRCCRLMVDGRGDDIEQAALDALEIGEDCGQPDAFVWFAPQFFTARDTQGRLAEVVDLVRQQVVDNPGLPIWRVTLAYALATVGEHEEATAIMEELVAAGSAVLPFDLVWLAGHAFLGEVLAKLGTPEAAGRQYERLAPYATRLPCVGSVIRPSVRLVLGMLAARAGWPERAEAAFAAAAEQHDRIGAGGWLARTHLEWGRFLLATGEGGRARELLAQARDAAEGLGAAGVRTDAEALLAGRS
jgi:class 3 adenylate cyclase